MPRILAYFKKKGSESKVNLSAWHIILFMYNIANPYNMTNNLSVDARMTLEQQRYVTKLRRKYWRLKIAVCLVTPLVMAWTVWVGVDIANYSSLSRNNQQGLVVSLIMMAGLAVFATIACVMKIEETRFELREAGEKPWWWRVLWVKSRQVGAFSFAGKLVDWTCPVRDVLFEFLSWRGNLRNDI